MIRGNGRKDFIEIWMREGEVEEVREVEKV
jgi:hypothetical protein